MKLFNIVFLLFLVPISFAQESPWWKSSNESETNNQVESTSTNSTPNGEQEAFIQGQLGEIEIHIDPRVEKLVEFKGATIHPNAGPMMDGFRVQLFFDQSKEKVNKARGELLKKDEEAEVYIEYKAPNYNLLLGNYRTRLEAEKAQADLMELFPEALVVTSRIYLPSILETPDEY